MVIVDMLMHQTLMLMAFLTVLQVPGDIHVGILFNLAKPLKATKEDLPVFWRGLD